ncbi:basic phospholipase A2 RVV-VD-like isoform 1-T1 [Anomaloglossus baeobatrachus]|uniref:basic phospholipase A2 RVV-VD-like n=1 Tax=Anomaloglossus baeobatrachus TaxID=238106 RepID=UPI003F50BCC5
MVFSWIFPVCLRGTMLSSLLLLLSLVSVEGAVSYLSDFNTMLIETMNKRLHDFYFYGCQCLFPRGDQIMDGIDRCCHQRFCCYRTERIKGCKDSPMFYYYTYSNGTITCDDEESGCARKFCECDWKARMCFMSHKYSEKYQKHTTLGKCTGRPLSCKIYNSQ